MPPFSFPPPLPSLFFEPRLYRPHGIGYWSGHTPFACDLVHTLRPTVFVELGTHTGESYFAFCQAISESGISCRAHAVDTWQGDQHTGAYGEQVFQEVSAHNQQYNAFSTLERATFDDALNRFSHNSIHLLHIDGAHTYEAVRHDFDSWWPKVQPGGVVLLHDSFERGHNFGVWQLLHELSQHFPAAGFHHSHGLGVVCKPPLQPSHVAAAFVSASESEQTAIRRYYETCAASLYRSFFATHRQPSDWEIISQVFWRAHNEDFAELRSVRTSDVVGSTPRHIVLPIPAAPSPYAALQLKITLTPALLALQSISIFDAAGSQVQVVEPDHIPGLETMLIPQGALLLDTGSDKACLLPLPAATLRALSEHGGSISLLLVGLNPTSFTRSLPAVAPPPLWRRIFRGT